MVREAPGSGGRVLADLVRRRRALYGQVEHLRGGRQNLVEALRRHAVVRPHPGDPPARLRSGWRGATAG